MSNETDDRRQEPDMVAELIRTAGKRAEPPAEAYQQVLAAATAALRAKSARRRERRWIASAIAAGIAGVIVVSLLQWKTEGLRPQVATVIRTIGVVEYATEGEWKPVPGSRAELAAGTRLRTLAGAGGALELPGGASLRLAAATEVSFEGPRHLTLGVGTLYLDNHASLGTGYRIDTPIGTVRDVGTQFELRVSGKALRLRVREGRVEIDRAGDTLSGSMGEQLEVDLLGSVSRSLIATAGQAWQWTETLAPAPDVDGKPATELLKWVARETGRRLQYATPAVEQRAAAVILHGNIRHLAPLAALDVMLATTDLEYVLVGDTMEVRARVE